MFEDWFRRLDLPMSWEAFVSLPRHPAYRYEYANGIAEITGRAKYMHCRKCLSPADLQATNKADDAWEIRPLCDSDWSCLPNLFAQAFSGTVPFLTLEPENRLRAAESLLARTRTGGDGPFVPEACCAARSRETGEPIGAALVTLVPSHSLIWSCEQSLGEMVPHLTWIFVSPGESRRGLGIALLSYSSQGLTRIGYSNLYSTFLQGHQASMYWHWRAGFELLGHPASPGRINRSRQN